MSTLPHGWKVYFSAWALLLTLLGVTVFASYVPAGVLSFVLALGIATAKAALIVVYFMHLRSSPKVVWVVAAATVVWLGILFTLTFSDYETRAYLPKATVWQP
jgi:cytochrome c oxidase subunit 4